MQKWLEWIRELQAIGQAGMTYTENPFDRERFVRLRELAAEMMAALADEDVKTVRALFAGETGYQTPKVDVRGIVCQDGKLLLVKERSDGKWALPGGWADVNLTVKENVAKEIKEEANVDAKPLRIVAVLDRNRNFERPSPYSIYKIFVLCEPLGGAFAANIETADARYFAPDELPPLSEGRNTPEQIAMCFAAARDPHFVPVFD